MRVFVLTGIKIIPGKPSNQKAPTGFAGWCDIILSIMTPFVIFHTLRK